MNKELMNELNNDFEVVDNFYGFIVVFGFRHKDLDEYIIPDGVNIIGDKCFTESNLETIVIPDSVTIIGKNAFEKCKRLKNISISDSLKILENEAFIECESIKEVKLPNTLIKLGNASFAKCSSIENVEIPGDVRLIGIYAYTDLKKLKKLVIDDGITELLNSRFIVNDNIDEIFLPKSIKKIEENSIMFKGDYVIKDIYYSGSKEDYNNIEILDNKFKNANWHFDLH